MLALKDALEARYALLEARNWLKPGETLAEKTQVPAAPRPSERPRCA